MHNEYPLAGKKVALVGPGLMSIPPKGWGAVENIIWQYSKHLEKFGCHVTVFNSSNLDEIASEINAQEYDFVHVHYDEHIGFLNCHLKRPFACTTHYGYILQPNRWAHSYWQIYADTLSAPAIIALSDEIAKQYRYWNYQGPLHVLRNGADVSSFRFSSQGNGRALCLGKIEPRKQQALLAHMLEGHIEMDFAGPIVDVNFRSNVTCRYLGEWDKAYLHEHLTDYSCLVLLSDGEAAPLVVPEALAAGLSLVLSDSACANLDLKDFVSVLPANTRDSTFLLETIKHQIEMNKYHRFKIREYAEQYFDWAVIVKEYFEIINDIRRKPLSLKTRKVGIRFSFAWMMYRMKRLVEQELSVTQRVRRKLARLYTQRFTNLDK